MPLWFEYVLIELGVLVGMAGPFGMIRQHDVRDWRNASPIATTFCATGTASCVTISSSCIAELRLTNGPELRPEPRLANDPAYAWMERTLALAPATASGDFVRAGWLELGGGA